MQGAGYRFLTDKYKMRHIPHWRSSFVSDAKRGRHSVTEDNVREEFYPARNWPGERACDHLEFAIKYDGINLALLCSLFRHLEPQELADFILEHPVSTPRRKLWFFYEFLTGATLPLENAAKGNYTLLLDPEEYYTLKNGQLTISRPLFMPQPLRTVLSLFTLSRMETAVFIVF